MASLAAAFGTSSTTRRCTFSAVAHAGVSRRKRAAKGRVLLWTGLFGALLVDALTEALALVIGASACWCSVLGAHGLL